MPSIVTPMGDISIHAQEGIYISFTFELEDGSPRDVSAVPMKFKTPYFETELTPGAEDNELILNVAPGEMPNTIGQIIEFIVIEETASVQHLIWSGKLIMRGWAS